MAANRNGFQSVVNAQPAPAEPGDFASANPRTSVIAGAGAMKAAPAGLTVGLFAWADPATLLAYNVYAANRLLGFVHRENQGMITDFLGIASMLVPGGYPVTLMSRGDFWAFFAAPAAVGEAVYAVPATGVATVTSGGNQATPFKVASEVLADVSFTGVIDADGILTASAVTGVLSARQYLAGTGVNQNTQIVNQLGGTPGGAGTYQTTVQDVVSSTAMTATGGKLAKITSWQ